MDLILNEYYIVQLQLEAEGIVYIMSTAADCTIEEVAKAAPKGVKWFQLYIFKDRYDKSFQF